MASTAGQSEIRLGIRKTKLCGGWHEEIHFSSPGITAGSGPQSRCARQRPAKTFVGSIGDSMCGAKHMMRRERQGLHAGMRQGRSQVYPHRSQREDLSTQRPENARAVCGRQGESHGHAQRRHHLGHLHRRGKLTRSGSRQCDAPAAGSARHDALQQEIEISAIIVVTSRSERIGKELMDTEQSTPTAPGVESPPSGNGNIRNFQTEEKAQQAAPDAPEESSARALSGDWPQEL